MGCEGGDERVGLAGGGLGESGWPEAIAALDVVRDWGIGMPASVLERFVCFDWKEVAERGDQKG